MKIHCGTSVCGQEKGQPDKVADACTVCLHVKKEVQQTPPTTGGGIDLTPASSLRLQPLRSTPDFSSHGRRRNGRRQPARDVRCHPQGSQAFSFTHPSAAELDHDFLWRTTRALSERGRIGIFNRSSYEEVLIVRVHLEILLSQGLPDEIRDEKTIWKERCRSIVDFEEHLYRSGTRVIKCFLHLSKEKQRKRLLTRIDEPDKN